MTTTDITIERAALSDLVHSRWSCRAFEPTPVRRDQLDELVALAQQAPSWCNTQPWHVTLTADPAATDAFRQGLLKNATTPGIQRESDIPTPAGYDGAHAARRRESGLQLYAALGIERTDQERRTQQALRNFTLFDAPHVAIISVDRALGQYALLDTGIYVAHFLLAAQSLGLGAVAQGAIAHHAPFVRSHFDLPDDEAVLIAISLGWPDLSDPVNSFRTGRAPLPESVRII